MIAQVSEELKKLESKLNKVIDHFKYEMNSIRAGRANPAVLNKIVVDYYGAPTPLSQIANISVPEARLLTIAPWDSSMVKAVVKAIQASDIGINPSDDGKVIRLAFPQLTEERRKELVKQTKKVSEDCKILLRNERRDSIEILKKLKKDSAISEDDLTSHEKDVQKLTDKFIELLEKLQKEKDTEIMEI